MSQDLLVARGAQEPPDAASATALSRAVSVIVVNREVLRRSGGASADVTATSLVLLDRFVLLLGDPVGPLEIGVSGAILLVALELPVVGGATGSRIRCGTRPTGAVFAGPRWVRCFLALLRRHGAPVNGRVMPYLTEALPPCQETLNSWSRSWLKRFQKVSRSTGT